MSAQQSIGAVVFDVGETLVDETRAWGELVSATKMPSSLAASSPAPQLLPKSADACGSAPHELHRDGIHGFPRY
jgi:hypothetical protein